MWFWHSAALCFLLGVSVAQGAATTPDPGCGTVPADIVFLLDASGSVGRGNFDKQKQFVSRFAQTFDIGPNNVQIGVVTFSTDVHNQFNLNQHNSKNDLIHAIDGMPYQSGGTNTAKALNYVVTNSFTHAAGDRDHVANILIVMTDGQSADKTSTIAAANKVHGANIKTFGIGIGTGVNQDELNHIATDSKHVFTVSNFDALQTLQAELKKTACEIDGGWSKWGTYSPCSKSCGGGTHFHQRDCNNPPPANGGKNCVGNNRETAACNTGACPTTPPPTTTTTARTTPLPTTVQPGCGVVPADIVFILDSSGSVGSSNFQKMLDFVKSMVQGLDIGPNGTEISVVTFSDNHHLQFHLNRYHDKTSIVNAISNVHYSMGGTNTADALKYAREVSFTSANGKRPNAAQIAIVITDGKSNSPPATASEASRLRNDGVTVFSIGVGSGPNTDELKAMATDPDNDHVFVVNNFDALSHIKGELQQKACEVKVTTAPQTVNCGAKADIVFLLDSSGSVGSSNFRKMLDFVKNVSSTFTLGPNDVQVGVDTFSSSHRAEFNLSRFTDISALQHAVDAIHYDAGGTNTGAALAFMHSQSFSTAAGQRPNVPKIAIVVTDGNSMNSQLTATEADKARKDGIKIIAIGVGHGINDAELNAIGSDPDSQYVFRAENFDVLSSLKAQLSSKTCEASTPLTNATDCHAGAKADIIFNLDSSGSVGSANFDKMLEFVKSMVKNFQVGPNAIQVGLNIFSSRPYIQFQLNQHGDKNALMNAIDHVPYKSGGTNTGSALKEVYSKMFTASNGDRPDAPNIEIVITDGLSNNHPDTVKEASNSKQSGITLFSVGVGSGVSKAELNDIASDPDSTHVMTVGDFSQLQSIQGAFAAQTCAVIPPSPPSFVPTAPVHLTDPCQDNINNCAQYGGQACSGRYLDWAKVNCQRTCGFCPTAIPTVPPECKDALADCKSYDPAVCKSYGDWAVANCRQFCGYCSVNAVGANGFYGKCSYNGKTYSQGQTWSDGCAYECSCDDASKGQYSCYSKCPSYYNLPPQCILAQKTGDCCLQPVCDFSPSYHTTNGQTVGKVNGMNTCLYKSHNYFQGQTWQDGCEFDCQCVDAGAGMYTCQSRCPVYKGLPPECTLQKVAGKCCAEPKCTFNQQYGTFTGNGVISGPGVGATPTAPTQCVDKVPNCNLYNANMCTDSSYREWAVKNCPKFCNFCSMLNQPGPTDRCVYKGIAYAQGQTWLDNCDYECLCENAKYGYYRCNKRCPDYVNLPLGCHMAQSNTSCCKTVQCDAGNANFLGSATVPGVIGSQPIPNIVPTSAPQPGTPGATNAPSPGLVPKLAGCYVQGTLYQQGLRWTSGCDWACICEDGSTGRYRCEPKCPTFGQLPPSCTLVEDARDLCCKVPQCPASVNGTTIQIPIPTYGQGYSGYGTATMPASITGTGTGPVPTGTVGGSTFVNQQGSVTVSGSRNGCVYKGHTYQQGQAWDDGCDLKCTCIDGTLGTYRCLDRCPLYQNLPPQCHLLQDPNDHCCKTYSCDYSQANTTPPPAFARTTPATGGEYCVYKNQYYLQGEEWNDGCSYTCRCEDAAKGYFQCTDRCPKFDNIPLGCSWVSDQKDGCCRIPSCPSSSSGAAPSGYIGTFNGYGRPATLISNPNIAASAYGRACLYKGSIYQQGQTWVDGCDYTCECTDASTGKYRCNDRCPRYTSLPSNCHFVTDPNNRCCSQPDCSPVVGGACSDKRSDCAGYGQYACVAPYESWARDNCAKYCGYCGGNGPVTTPATVVCADKIPNCAAYTKTACSTNVNWARYNCINFCGLCGGTGGTGTGVITGGTGTGGTGTGVITGGTGTGTGGTGTGVNTGGTGTSGTGMGVITGGTGTGGTITGSGTCVDKIPNCVEFTRDACGDQFKNWALQNCPLFCNLCAQLSGTGSATGTATGTGGGFTGTGTINTGGNTGGVITGTSSVCYYKGQVYHTGETWQDGCSFNCTCTDGNTGTYRCLQLCTQYTNLPSGCILQKGQGECCAKPVCNGGTSGSGSTIINGNSQSGTMTGTTQGCTYKGHVYHQGEVFDDGCTFKCTCIDASRGQYNCVQKCVTWNLPSSCHLNAPAAGKCCKTPNCPPDVIINYPPNYVEE